MAETEAPQTTKTPSVEGTIWTVGRRKEAVARVKMWPGAGQITVNDKPIEDVYISPLEKSVVMAPLAIVERQETFDISIRVSGGGRKAQLGAIALGLARGLSTYDETLRSALKEHGLLTRDSRMKERKKYGLKRARKAPQFSKR